MPRRTSAILCGKKLTREGPSALAVRRKIFTAKDAEARGGAQRRMDALQICWTLGGQEVAASRAGDQLRRPSVVGFDSPAHLSKPRKTKSRDSSILLCAPPRSSVVKNPRARDLHPSPSGERSSSRRTLRRAGACGGGWTRYR